MSWQALRIDHHERDHGALIVEAVRPLVDEMRKDERVASVILRTHWSQGPHLLLVFETDEAHFRDRLFPLAKARLEAWLAEHPSTVQLDPAAYTEQSAAWAKAEGEGPPPPGLLANNRVTTARYERPPPMGLDELAAIRDRFHAEALDLAFEMIALRRQGKAAFLVESACLVAAVSLVTADDRFDFWPTSMLAHSDGYLASRPQARAGFETYHAQLGAALASRFSRFGIMHGEVGAWTPLLALWIDILRRMLARLEPVVAAHQAQLADHDVYAGTRDSAVPQGASGMPLRFRMIAAAARLLPRRFTAAMAFRLLSRSPWAVRRAAIMRTQVHLEYRIMINFIYGLLPLLGISPAERACLCYLIWRSCETSFPEARERARRSVEALGGLAMAAQTA